MFETSSFGPIEKALLQSHGIPEWAAGAFRGRITNLQKQGLLGPENRPGRGVALTYGPNELHKLVLAAELLELGIAPSIVLAVVDSLWDSRLRKMFDEAKNPAQEHDKPGPDDIVMHVGGASLLLDTWSGAVPNVSYCKLRDLPQKIGEWMRMRGNSPLPPRALIVNLSERLRSFHAAFAETYLADAVAERGAAKMETKTAGKSRRKGS